MDAQARPAQHSPAQCPIIAVLTPLYASQCVERACDVENAHVPSFLSDVIFFAFERC